MHLARIGGRRDPIGLETLAFPPCAALFGRAIPGGSGFSPAARRTIDAVGIGPV
jgi:hypothetical protein